MVDPARHKFTIWRGATFKKVLSMLDENGEPFDLSDYTANLTIQVSGTNNTELLVLTSENDGISFGPGVEEMELFISADDTAGLTWRNGYYTLKTISPLNDTDIILYGGFSVVG